MKKALIVVASMIGVLVLALVLIPIIFKDDIQKAVDQELDKNLNASVYYNTDRFDLSLISNFPNITLSIGDFGIVGKAPFEGDTLLHIGTFELMLDLMSVINGESIEIVNVLLDEAKVTVLVLEDGSANYDIAKETEEVDTSTEEESESALAIGIQRWELRNSDIIYMDQTIPTTALLFGVNHVGSGDLKSDLFDIVTTTSVAQFTVDYDGDTYISDRQLKADMVMAMDLATMKFTFKENRVALNDFAFGFDGWVSMPADDIEMEITYAGKEIDLKSILSLIPGTYQEYLAGVTAAGQVAFDGYVRGIYNDSLMPKVAANFQIADGRIAYADYPIPMEQIQVKANFDYPSADLRESSFTMEKFEMLVDGERLSASLLFKDFQDYYWDFKMNGSVDLEKVTKIVPVEGMTLRGKIKSDLQTLGRMSDLDAGEYEKLTTSGGMEITGFQYESPDLPQGFGISTAKMTFNPKEIKLETFKANAGLTDLNMSGTISNYIQYVLNDSALLVGNFDFNSTLVDLNEWMTTDTAAIEEADTAVLEIVRIPENIDFTLASSISTMKYDLMDIKDFKGKVIIKNGVIALEKVRFNVLDGAFEMNGSYNSASNLELPLYDFSFKIDHLSIPSAFKTFNTVRKLAPFAEKMVGTFSTDLKVNGTIGEGMMPVYETMQGAGLMAIQQASMQNVKLLSAVSSVTKLNQEDGSLTLKDVLMTLEIRDGRVFVEPFELTLGGRKTTLSGSAGVDGTLDAAILTNVPTGQLGDAANALLSSFAGTSSLVSANMDLTLGITGTYDDPKVKLLSAKPAGTDGSNSLKAALKDQAAEKVDAAKAEAKAVVDEKKEEVMQVVDEKKEEVKAEVQEQKQEATDKAKQELNNLLKKKKKDVGL